MSRRRTGLRSRAIATPGVGTGRDGSDAGDGVGDRRALAGRHATGWLGSGLISVGPAVYAHAPTPMRLDAAKGTIVWTSEGPASSRTPAYAHGIVVTAVDGRRITARNASSGALLWAKWNPGASCDPAIAGSDIYVSSGRTLYAHDLATGAPRWVWTDQRHGTDIGDRPNSTATVYGSRIFLTRACNALVAAVDRTTGPAIWQRQIHTSSTATRSTAYRSPTRPVPSMSEVTTAADACGPSSSRRGPKGGPHGSPGRFIASR